MEANSIERYTSIKLLWNMKPMWNIDAPNGFSYHMMHLLCETVYKRVNHNWNQYNLVWCLNETIFKHETYVKPRCTKWILVLNDVPTLWSNLKRVNHKCNKYNLVPHLHETIVKHEIMLNLDAPNYWILRTKRYVYFVIPSINLV
jgi:hypothetical protein